MNGLKSITLRLPADEYTAFDTICNERGYNKTGKIREFIRNLVKEEIEAVKVSAAEWAEIEAGIKEIQSGKFTTFEELKRDLSQRKMGHNKNCK